MNLTRTVKAPEPYKRYSVAGGEGEKDICSWEIRNDGDTGAKVKLVVSNRIRPVSPIPVVSFSGDAVVFVVEEFVGYGDGEPNQEMNFKNSPKLQDAANTGEWLKVYCNGTKLSYGTDYLVSVEDKRLNFDAFDVPEGALITTDYRFDDPLETSYKYALVALDTHGEAAPSEIVDIKGPAVLGQDNSISVSWEASPYAIGYWLFRRVESRQWEVVDRAVGDLSYLDNQPFWETTQGLPSIDDSGVLYSLSHELLDRLSAIESDNKVFLETGQELAFWADSENVELIVSGAGMTP